MKLMVAHLSFVVFKLLFYIGLQKVCFGVGPLAHRMLLVHCPPIQPADRRVAQL